MCILYQHNYMCSHIAHRFIDCELSSHPAPDVPTCPRAEWEIVHMEEPAMCGACWTAAREIEQTMIENENREESKKNGKRKATDIGSKHSQQKGRKR